MNLFLLEYSSSVCPSSPVPAVRPLLCQEWAPAEGAAKRELTARVWEEDMESSSAVLPGCLKTPAALEVLLWSPSVGGACSWQACGDFIVQVRC